MKGLRRFARRHPTAVLRTIALALAACFLGRAIVLTGSPEASVTLGIVAMLCAIVATMDIELSPSLDEMSQAWRERNR